MQFIVCGLSCLILFSQIEKFIIFIHSFSRFTSTTFNIYYHFFILFFDLVTLIFSIIAYFSYSFNSLYISFFYLKFRWLSWIFGFIWNRICLKAHRIFIELLILNNQHNMKYLTTIIFLKMFDLQLCLLNIWLSYRSSNSCV